MLVMKLIVLLVLAGVVWFITLTVRYGREMAGKKRRTRLLLNQHRDNGSKAIWGILIALVLLECMVRIPLFKAHTIDPLLFRWHLTFAASFLVSLVLLKFFLTGEKNSRVHRFLAYGVGPLCLIVAGPTGLVMLCQM